MIKIGQIRVRDNPAVGEPMHVVHVSTICLDCFVCGMAPFGEYLTVLAYGQRDDDDDDDDDNGGGGAAGQSSHPIDAVA